MVIFSLDETYLLTSTKYITYNLCVNKVLSLKKESQHKLKKASLLLKLY